MNRETLSQRSKRITPTSTTGVLYRYPYFPLNTSEIVHDFRNTGVPWYRVTCEGRSRGWVDGMTSGDRQRVMSCV